MLGNRDDIKAKQENIKDPESCYGGFGSRFSYERHVNGGTAPVGIAKRVLFFTGILLMMLSIGLLCAAVIFRIVAVNSSLYFPNGNRIVKSSADTSVRRSAVTATAQAEAALASVSFEDSQRYRVPTGVMVRTESSADELVPGLMPGDIITSVNGTEVYDVDSLYAALSESFTSDSTRLTVFRENGYVIITMAADLCNTSVMAE